MPKPNHKQTSLNAGLAAFIATAITQPASRRLSTALDAAWDLVKDWTSEDRDYLRRRAPWIGLSTKFQGLPLSDLARDVDN